MTHSARTIIASLVTLVLAACSTTTVPLAPGAERVKITDNPSDVAGCTAVGNLDHLVPPDPFNYHNNDNNYSARNQAIGLGGNTILDTTPRGALTLKIGIGSGVVYRCDGAAPTAGK